MKKKHSNINGWDLKLEPFLAFAKKGSNFKMK